MWRMPKRPKTSRVFDGRAQASRGALLAGAVHARAAAARDHARCRCSRAPGSTPRRCASRRMSWRSASSAPPQRPIAAPSANRSGRVSPTTAAHVAAELDGRIAAILDGGPCRVGLESTVLDLSGARAAPAAPRRHARSRRSKPRSARSRARRSGGARRARRACSRAITRRRCRCGSRRASVAADEALLAFGRARAAGRRARRLAEPHGRSRSRRRPISSPRCARSTGPNYRAIAVMPIPEHGLGLAINDRLRRAAAPRQALAGGGGAG